MKFNINDKVKVKLRESGRDIIRSQNSIWFPPEDNDGWSTWQLWAFMQEFGAYLYLGSELPFEPDIEIEIDDKIPDQCNDHVHEIMEHFTRDDFCQACGQELRNK